MGIPEHCWRPAYAHGKGTAVPCPSARQSLSTPSGWNALGRRRKERTRPGPATMCASQALSEIASHFKERALAGDNKGRSVAQGGAYLLGAVGVL